MKKFVDRKEDHAIEFTQSEVREALELVFKCKIPTNAYLSANPFHYSNGVRFHWNFDIKNEK